MNEMGNRELNELSDEFVMDSLQLCETINKYRQEEGKDAVLQHNNLMKSIKTELEALEKAGIRGEVNFYRSSYISSQNKKLPCYALTKFGAMQILNKESAFVRYKTQEYIEELEYRNSVLQVPYDEMAEDRYLNGFNIKEINTYIDSASIDDLSNIQFLLFKQMGYYPYTAYVKKYFDPFDIKQIDKLIKSHDFKDDGIKTLTTQEFIDLLESSAIPYSSMSGKLKINDIIVSKGKIKVLSDKAMIHLALVLKDSEVAKQYRQFLISNQFIELQQINEVTNEKDIKTLQALQKQTIEMMNRLDEKEKLLNEREVLLNEREKRINEEQKVIKGIKSIVKKLFKMFFGGEQENFDEIEKETDNIINDTIIDVEIIEETDSKINEYHAPSETRGPICNVPIGKPVPVKATHIEIPQTKTVSTWRAEFKGLVEKIASEYNLTQQFVYNEAYRELRRRFHKPYIPQYGTSVVKTLKINELRIAIKFLNERYPLSPVEA